MSEKPRALILASVASMIEQFNMNNIQLLLDNGYQVDVACNCKEGNTISDERVQEMIRILSEKDVSVIHIPIPRKLSRIFDVITAYKQVKKLCNDKHYKLLHCHSPIGSVVARLGAKNARKRYGTKVIYTAHGFHFYKGAPIQNWVFFYPVEKILSRITDVLITINKEDYAFAKRHMKAKQIEYVPGIGVDVDKFRVDRDDRNVKRAEFNLSDKDIMIFSVGELNQNKNHETIIKAIAKLQNDNIHYFIAGIGERKEYLTALANDLNVQLHLLGYRKDIPELLNAADIFAFPSFREGLSVALMEAMASGLPCVASKIRGNVDLIEETRGGCLYEPSDVTGFSEGISYFCRIDNPQIHIDANQNRIQLFSSSMILKELIKIYEIGDVLC